MPKPAERLALLREIHGDSTRSAATRCSLDHSTILRVEGGETENPATLAKIAEGYGVPLAWVQGRPDPTTDFACAVLLRPLQERISFLRDPEHRWGFAVQFVVQHAPDRYTPDRLGELLNLPESEITHVLAEGRGHVTPAVIEAFCAETGLSARWFHTGLIGWENEEEILVGLAEWALRSVAELVGVDLSADKIHGAAVALI